jgi:hypothetical protein
VEHRLPIATSSGQKRTLMPKKSRATPTQSPPSPRARPTSRETRINGVSRTTNGLWRPPLNLPTLKSRWSLAVDPQFLPSSILRKVVDPLRSPSKTRGSQPFLLEMKTVTWNQWLGNAAPRCHLCHLPSACVLRRRWPPRCLPRLYQTLGHPTFSSLPIPGLPRGSQRSGLGVRLLTPMAPTGSLRRRSGPCSLVLGLRRRWSRKRDQGCIAQGVP